MLRFASSPTGDMHIGNLRVALLNYIVAQQQKEDLIVRIEDIDKEKNIEGKDQEILDILALFNINYSQVIYQSQNIRFHSAMALQLLHEKKAFSCFCSPEHLKTIDMYNDACKNLPAELVIDNTNPFTIRITRPQGDISLRSDMLESFIIMHQDKTPTYSFACAVDDMLSDISIVIHDENHKSDALKQDHIRASLQYEKQVEYIHLPAIHDDTPSVKWLLEQGYLPEAISNYLILISSETPQEVFTLKEAIKWFDLSKVSNSPTQFDIDMLKHINKQHLKNLDAKELSRYVGFADEEIGELARMYLNEAGTTRELKAKIAPIFSPRAIADEFKEQVDIMKQAIKSAPFFEEYDDFRTYIMKESGLKGEKFTKTLRILLTNTQDGPDVAELYKYLKNYIGEIVK